MNEVQALEQGLQAIVSAVQHMIQNGEDLSDELQGQVANIINLAVQRIQELSVEPVQIPELDTAPYESSNISRFKYDPKNQKLFVQFLGKYPNANGPTYSYDNVPEFIYDVFRRGAVGPKTTGKNKWHAWHEGVTPSLGAAMNALIKAGGYNYQRLS